MQCYFSARASTCVISWIDSVLSEQVRCLMAITCPRVEYRSEGVMPITASTRAAPHSSACICAGPDCSLAWDSNDWLPPFTGNYGCDCLRKVDLGTAGRGNPKYPAITMRETTSRALPCLAGRCQVGWPYTGPAWRPGRLPSGRAPGGGVAGRSKAASERALR
jgi:hypothetical protein